MLFKNLFPALSLLLVASTKLVKAAPLQELTGTAADAYQYVECTFTVQEIGDKPYTVVTRSWKPSSYRIDAGSTGTLKSVLVSRSPRRKLSFKRCRGGL
ncbi:hypothetical protein DFP72DRAFT_920413, partial [Ephemerocybe angulata]